MHPLETCLSLVISQLLFGLCLCNTSTIFILNDLASIEECPGKLQYRVSTNITKSFAPYLKASASSEQECAHFCYAKLLFCFAAKFDPNSRICEFTFQRNVRSCHSDPTELTMGPTQPRIIYCLECEKSSSSSTAKFHLPTTTVVAPPGITPTNSQKPESKTDKIILAKSGGAVSTSLLKVVNQTTTILTTEQTTIPTTIEVESSTISAITTTTEDPVTTSVVPTSTSFTSSITTSTSASTSTTDSLHTHIAPIIMNKPWVKSWILRQPFTNCSQDMLKPCSHDIGRDCAIETMPDGCYACKCPPKSPAKGCLGSFWQSGEERKDLIMKKKTCPSGKYAQSVLRFYRKIDVMKNFDDCVLTVQPYCGMRSDRMPRTNGECRYYCYSNIENLADFISS